MSFIFAGGEDHDFLRVGVTSVDTATSAARRTGNARCSLKVGVSASGVDGWKGAFNAATSEFWLTARHYYTNGAAGATTAEWLSFFDGATKRLRLRPNSAISTPQTFALTKLDASGTSTALATATSTLARDTLIKVDVYVKYAVAGQFDLYFDGVLALTYSGDLTTNSATTLSDFLLGQIGVGSSHAHYWSEAIAGSADTRSMGLVTLPPAANGNTFNFDTGSYSNLDEVATDDTDIATSGTANQLAQTTVTSSGITGNPAIRAVCVSARAQKGGTGPANAQLNVRTASADYFTGNIALPASLRLISNIWETNPATSGAWAYTDLTAAGFNIGVKSIT